MGVNHHRELLNCGAGSHCVSTLLNQICGMDANNVHSHNLASVFVEEYLSDTISFSFGKSFTVRSEISLGLSKRPTLFLRKLFGLLFRGTNHSDLWMREASRRDCVMVYDMSAPNNVLNSRNTLSRGSMSEHHFPVCVSNAVHVWNDFTPFTLEHLHLIRYMNETSISLDARFLQTHVCGIGNTARGDHCGIDLKGLHMFLRLGVNHLNSHRFLSRNARCNF
mmetsp:Transcript_17480/g.25862  ORF Transcript_17480/g.25862 Transcript_17480/m.25862 type:complete len:222 (+) Transcript_17480:250-915(+)